MSQTPHSKNNQNDKALREANEDAITQLLLCLATEEPKTSKCKHGELELKFCTAQRSTTRLHNAGRWYGICGPCKKWRWLSRRLKYQDLFANEEFATLIAVRESLRLPPRDKGFSIRPTTAIRRSTRNSGVVKNSSANVSVSRSAITPILSHSILLKFWMENLMNPHCIAIPRTAGEAFSLGDHKLILGESGIEQVDSFEFYDKLTRSWYPIPWNKKIFPATESRLCFHLRGITSLNGFVG